MAVLQNLIDKQDNYEIVRDQIAVILKTEITNQVQLAIDAGKDSTLWDLRVFTELSNQQEFYRDQTTDLRPIVNIWFDSANYAKDSGSTVFQQKSDTTINIDIIARGLAQETVEGHEPGDKDAALNLQTAITLVRNILMASLNVSLQLPQIVWDRWPQSIQCFQPEISDPHGVQLHGARINFSVTHSEFSPQYDGEILESVFVEVYRCETGELLFNAQFEVPEAFTYTFPFILS